MIDPQLTGKTVLITGANNPLGIGAATARAFAAQGAQVFIHYFRLDQVEPGKPASALEAGEAFYRQLQTHDASQILEDLRHLGTRAAAWEADLVDPSAVPVLFERAESELGPVEVLVNNAAYCVQDTFLPASLLGPDSRAVDAFPLTTLTAELHDRHFAVNSRAVALMMAEFARRHIAREAVRGRIINLSTDGSSGFATEISYGASKHALESYSRAAAKELGRFGITVNVASLGPIQTGWMSPEVVQAVLPGTPLGRLGTPEDVADVIVFLASEQARWLTGQTVFIGGGWTMPL